MSNLQTVLSVYESIDNHLKSLLAKVDLSGGQPTREFVEQSRVINDQAYFVLAWGQLEAEVDEACRDVILSGQSQQLWSLRRVWSLYDPDDQKRSGLSFKNRLSLVLEAGSGPWTVTMKHYRMRNRIAHGELLSTRLEPEDMMQDLIGVRSLLAHR